MEGNRRGRAEDEVYGALQLQASISRDVVTTMKSKDRFQALKADLSESGYHEAGVISSPDLQELALNKSSMSPLL